MLPTDQAPPSPAQSRLIPLPHRPVPGRIIDATASTASAKFHTAAPSTRSLAVPANFPAQFELLVVRPAAAPTSLNDLKPFNLSTVLIDVHKDCYKSISQAQQGGRHRRKTKDLPPKSTAHCYVTLPQSFGCQPLSIRPKSRTPVPLNRWADLLALIRSYFVGQSLRQQTSQIVTRTAQFVNLPR